MTSELDQLRMVALPSLIGQRIGKDLWAKPYVVYPWIKYMESRIVDAIMDTQHERYIAVAAPPQTGKSTYVGLLLPFWVTGMFPQWQLMYVSYGDDFSTIRGKEVQALHKRYGRQFFGSVIDPDFSSGSDWRLKGSMGGMLSVGVGGQITGRPGHVIVIDDLIKRAEEAASKTTLSKHVDEWDRTISTRVQPGGTVILIATRWAEADLQGVLRDRMAEPDYDGPRWEFIEFPAFAEPPPEVELTEEETKAWRDVIGREYGEVLDCRFSDPRELGPDRARDDFFRLKRASTDPYAWSALYQQHPSIREGGLFTKATWKYEDPETFPWMNEIVRVWDLAVTEDGGDFTVGCKCGRGEDGRFYVLDVKRFRRSAGDVQNAVELCAKLDGYGCRIMVEEEKGGSGRSVTEFYRRLLPGYRVDPAKAEGDKVSRATPYAAQQNNGNVVLPFPGSVDWSVKDFVDEHSRLMTDGRGPRNDDQIDTAAYAIASLVGATGVDMWIPGRQRTLSPEAQVRRLLADPITMGAGFSR